MSLPAGWVDRIFDKLALTYGRDFLGRYEGMDINAVKSDWAHELSGFFAHPSAIAFALSSLPDRAPSVIEFRKIARLAPAAEAPRIEVSPAGKERIAAELAKVAPVLKAPTSGFRDWARRIVARHESGGRITKAQIDMARDALKGHAA